MHKCELQLIFENDNINYCSASENLIFSLSAPYLQWDFHKFSKVYSVNKIFKISSKTKLNLHYLRRKWQIHSFKPTWIMWNTIRELTAYSWKSKISFLNIKFLDSLHIASYSHYHVFYFVRLGNHKKQFIFKGKTEENYICTKYFGKYKRPLKN